MYTSTLQRALAMTSRQNVQTALTTEAVLAAVRTEFLKLLQSHLRTPRRHRVFAKP